MLAELVADHPYLIAQASSPHDLAQAAYGLPGPSRDAGRLMLHRSVGRGKLSPSTDIKTALDLIADPVLMRAIIGSRELARPVWYS